MDKEVKTMILDTLFAKSIMANQHALHQNEMLAKIPKMYKGKLKEKLRPVILELINAERKEFEKVDALKNEIVTDVYRSMDRFFHTLAKSAFVDYNELDFVLKALAKDRASIIGIANKILI